MAEPSVGAGVGPGLPRPIAGLSGWPAVLLRIAPLVLVLPPLAAFLLTRPSDERLISLVPAVAAFAAIVVWALVASRPRVSRRATVASIVLTLLAVTVTLADPDTLWLTLFYYPAIGAGLVGQMRQAVAAIAAVSAIAAIAGWFVVRDPVAAIEFALECVLIGSAALVVARLVSANRELALARAEVARLAAADERARIARDLHDLLGHGLSLITLKAELAGRLLPTSSETAAAEVRDIEAVSRRALEDVRAAVTGYRRVTLDGELVGARATLEAAGIAVDVEHGLQDLPGTIDETLAWSVREGVTNIIRHSQARNCWLRTGRDDGRARLEVLNDGPGGRARAGGRGQEAPARGNGLNGLAERVAAAGGRLEAGPLPDGGFRLSLEVPVEEADG